MKTMRIALTALIFPFLVTAFSGIENLPNRTQYMVEQQLDGGSIPVAAIANSDETRSAAAYSSASDQYLVVYEQSSNNGDILGQFIDASTGNLLGGWFHIANSPDEEFSPAVVYDSHSDRFLVVWQELYCMSGFCYHGIQGRLVYGSEKNGKNVAGDKFVIANEHQPDASGYDLITPAVAYNEEDHQFMVVYIKGKLTLNTFKSVYGQFLSSDKSSPQVLTGNLGGFEIRTEMTAAELASPDTAWSPHGGTFLVIWEKYWPTTAGVDVILSRYAFDTFQGAGKEQVQGAGAYYLVPAYRLGDDPLVDDYNNPAVAYDPQSQNYVVVFTHFQDKGPDSSRLIYGQRLENYYIDSTPNVGYEIEIETTFKSNYIPEIAHSGIRDEMYVVYLTETEQKGDTFYSIIQRTLRGKNLNPSLEIHKSVADGYLENPVVAGTSNGRAMVVWDEVFYESPYDFDLNGQRIKPYSKVYMPSVVR